MKSIARVAVLGVGLWSVPALLGQESGTDAPTPPAAPLAPKPTPTRPGRATAAPDEQFDRATQQFDRAAEQLDAARAELAAVDERISPWVIGGGASSGRSLVVPKEDSDAKGIEECEEDLNVMARILEKAGGRRGDKGNKAMGIVVHGGLFDQSSAPRNLYLDGYGAVFFLNVNYPLVAPPAKKADLEPKAEANAEWEEARRELYQPPSGSQNFTFVTPGPMLGGGAAEEYDADRVEDLKKDLIGALKNAAHIRRLKPEEAVAVVVTGRGATSSTKPKRVVRQPNGGGGGGFGGGGSSGAYYSSSGSTRFAAVVRRGGDGESTKMILRAKKSDIDAAQKGALSTEDLARKVSVQVY